MDGMTDERGASAVFRLRLPDGSIRLASGHARSGPGLASWSRG